MRTITLFLYFTALAGLLLGVGECIALALGGATSDAFLANGFVLISLALGARFQGAGFVPIRASFALLGLAGAMPLLAGFAPLGAAFAAFLFLPLRATGARLSSAIGSSAAGFSLLAFGSFCASILTSAWAPGLPGFLLLWLVAGILQRFLVPTPTNSDPSPAPQVQAVLPGLFGGAGVILLFLFLSPYFALLDSSSLQQDLRRELALGVIFFATWFTLGSGFASTSLRPFFAAFAGLALALFIGTFLATIEFVASPEGYRIWLSNPSLLNLSSFDVPVLAEQSPLYASALAAIMFALPCALCALFLRTLANQDTPGPGPNSLTSILGGAGVALVACGLLPTASLLSNLAMLTAGLLVFASISSFWAASNKPVLRWSGVALALGLTAIFLRPVALPTLQHPLVDSFIWSPSIQQKDFFSLPRVLKRQSGQPGDDLSGLFLFDGRNDLSAPQLAPESRQAEILFARAIANQPSNICWVGIPDARYAALFLDNAKSKLTIACDPPSLARLAFHDSPPSTQLEFHQSLTTCDGPYNLVFMQSMAMWESRHSVLRAELLRQAALRLEKDGVCVFIASPEDFAPGLLPQWINEFKNVFAQTSVFLLPDGLSQTRILIAGRRAQDEQPEWPLPEGALLQELTRLGLPIADADDLAALEIQFPDRLDSGNTWQFRGPFRPSDAALSATAFQLIAKTSVAQRSAQVLAELQAFEMQGHASLLGFYAAQFAAQEYSVHDTYLGGNPLAIETSANALDLLMRTTLEFPNAATLHRTWAEVGVNLVESREVAWIEQYFGRLQNELQWPDAEIRLALAHAAMEMLDFETALENIDAILLEFPEFQPAKELRALTLQEQQVPRDSHAGHNH